MLDMLILFFYPDRSIGPKIKRIFKEFQLWQI